jgi:alpha-L-rhamnosidase
MKYCKFIVVSAMCLMFLQAAGFAGWCSSDKISPAGLSCEYRENPLGIDVAKPRLSWVMGGSDQCSVISNQNSEIGNSVICNLKSEITRGVKQTAYQVLVASSEELLKKDKGDLWDSGKVEADQQNQIEYTGKPLASRMQCYWKVRVWLASRSLGEGWSKPACWTMGLLKPDDWQAKWVGVNPSKAGVTRTAGKLHIVGATYQTVDGEKTRDVTEMLASKVNENTLALTITNEAMGGDLAFGKKKNLLVTYELDHQRLQKTVDEGDMLTLNRESESEWATPRYLRKTFALDRTVRRATLYVTALGLYELHLNGQRVGDHLLTPEWTNYRKHVLYQTYDVTAMVRNGPNALAAVLGNGWYCGGWQKWRSKLEAIYGTEPYLLAQLEIELSDGTSQTIASDDSWRGTANGPLQFAGIYEGASYDARKEMPGWDTAVFDDARWTAVKTAGTNLVVGQLVWQRGNPIRVTRELKPVALTEPKPGIYVFAFDQNMVGTSRFTFKGAAGDTVELQHGEMLEKDGTVFRGNLTVASRHRIQLDCYTFRGNGPETFQAPFTYHGFQYVEVRGLKTKPSLDDLAGVVFNSDCPEVGSFTCSEPMLNRLAKNIVWSQRSNYMGVPTDCPQRNERCGYTGDAQFFMRAAVYNMDVSAFFSRWLVDVCEDAQMPSGHFADHAPTFGPGDGPNIGWSDAGIICPFEIYRTYGDTRIIREHYAAMKRNLEWLARASKDYLFTGHVGNGDWLSTGGGVGKDVIGTAYSAFDFQLMAQMADAIGETGDAAAFRERSGRIAEAFVKAYVDKEGRIMGSSQSGYAMAFTMGLVPDALKEKMTERFAEEVSRFDWHPRTGFIGTPRLLPGLHRAGRDDDAYKILLTKTAPSWLYPVSVGATTIWEQWVGWDGKNPRGGMNSLNHYSFGAVGEYMFGMIGGIQPETPGYQRIRIQPVIREGLTWAKTSYDSIRGKIVSNWRLEEGNSKLETGSSKTGTRPLTMEVTIPANTTATVYVPAKEESGVTESGTPAAKADGVKFLRMDDGAAVYEVGSGTYRFGSVL